MYVDAVLNDLILTAFLPQKEHISSSLNVMGKSKSGDFLETVWHKKHWDEAGLMTGIKLLDTVRSKS